MKLFCKQYSTIGEPLVILHGLFGHQGNWAVHARSLSERFAVFAFDARNHGRSPWHERISYADMANDVSVTMEAQGIRSAHFIGHSMGGKTAMQLALQDAAKIQKLIVVDIAPVDYANGPDTVLEALQSVNLAQIKSRDEAGNSLKGLIADKGVRDFLLSNLQRDKESDGYKWRFNLNAIVAQYANIKSGLNAHQPYSDELLFIKGSQSDYILPEYRDATAKLFPKASLKIIENAGHWVHSEKPAAFAKIVEKYLSQ